MLKGENMRDGILCQQTKILKQDHYKVYAVNTSCACKSHLKWC